MNETSLSYLFFLLGFMILASAFFSASEVAMLALNRYRLRHLVKEKHKGAMRASSLLENTDRLIGVILIGSNFINVAATSLATIIAIRLWGDNGVWIATTAEHHASLAAELPGLRSITVLGDGVTGWQVLPADEPAFEESVRHACALVLRGDPRIGKIPASKRRR